MQIFLSENYLNKLFDMAQEVEKVDPSTWELCNIDNSIFNSDYDTITDNEGNFKNMKTAEYIAELDPTTICSMINEILEYRLLKRNQIYK